MVGPLPLPSREVSELHRVAGAWALPLLRVQDLRGRLQVRRADRGALVRRGAQEARRARRRRDRGRAPRPRSGRRSARAQGQGRPLWDQHAGKRVLHAHAPRASARGASTRGARATWAAGLGPDRRRLRYRLRAAWLGWPDDAPLQDRDFTRPRRAGGAPRASVDGLRFLRRLSAPAHGGDSRCPGPHRRLQRSRAAFAARGRRPQEQRASEVRELERVGHLQQGADAVRPLSSQERDPHRGGGSDRRGQLRPHRDARARDRQRGRSRAWPHARCRQSLQPETREGPRRLRPPPRHRHRLALQP